MEDLQKIILFEKNKPANGKLFLERSDRKLMLIRVYIILF
jgi:hypothetical protein